MGSYNLPCSDRLLQKWVVFGSPKHIKIAVDVHLILSLRDREKPEKGSHCEHGTGEAGINVRSVKL